MASGIDMNGRPPRGEWLTVTYRVAAPPERVKERAQAIAIEQSIECPLEAVGDARVRAEIVGRVGEMRQRGPALFEVDVLLAAQTIAGDPAQFMSMVYGNVSLFSDVELLDVALPPGLRAAFPGPRHGIAGIRGLTGARYRALTNVALKPQGLHVRDLARICVEFALGGVDIIKDDHGIADQPYSPFAERVPALQAAVRAAAEATGHQSFYAPNLVGTPTTLREHAAIARDAGCRVVLVAPMLIGLPAFFDLVREFPNFVYLAHPSFAGAPHVAAPFLFGKLLRLYGADAVIFVNYGGRFAYAPQTCADLATNLRAPWDGVRAALPVPAGGMRLERVGELLDFYGPETMLLIGGDLLIAHDRLRERTREFVTAVERHTYAAVGS